MNAYLRIEEVGCASKGTMLMVRYVQQAACQYTLAEPTTVDGLRRPRLWHCSRPTLWSAMYMQYFNIGHYYTLLREETVTGSLRRWNQMTPHA